MMEAAYLNHRDFTYIKVLQKERVISFDPYKIEIVKVGN